MKSGAQIGVAVAAGYVLGRFHKMKWAMALATMAGRKRLASQGGMLKQGTKLMQSSPELTKLTDDIKGSLAEAGKAAAIAAVGSRISSLSEGLRERSESLRAASLAGSGGQSAARADDQDDDLDEDQDDRDSGDGERSRPRASGRARPDGDRRRPGSSEPGRSESGRSRSRSSESRSSEGRSSESRSSERPSRRPSAEESVPRPRKRPAEESTRQPSRRRRETAHD